MDPVTDLAERFNIPATDRALNELAAAWLRVQDLGQLDDREERLRVRRARRAARIPNQGPRWIPD